VSEAENPRDPSEAVPAEESGPEAPPPPPSVPADERLPGAPPPAPPPSVPGGASAVPKTAEERKGGLANALQGQVASGARIESQSDYQAVVIRGHRVNHLLHFFVGLFTLGLWWLVWIGMAIFGGEKRQMVTVDEFGNVFVQKI
jgi:hypothetical protein